MAIRRNAWQRGDAPHATPSTASMVFSGSDPGSYTQRRQRAPSAPAAAASTSPRQLLAWDRLQKVKKHAHLHASQYKTQAKRLTASPRGGARPRGQRGHTPGAGARAQTRAPGPGARAVGGRAPGATQGEDAHARGVQGEAGCRVDARIHARGARVNTRVLIHAFVATNTPFVPFS